MQDSSKERDEYRVAVNYLLGELIGSEAEEFEQRYLANQETFEFLEAVEEELIEDYLRGTLGPDDKSLFERRYMSRPDAREKIEFAKSLLDCAGPEPDERAAGVGTAHRVRVPEPRPGRRSPRWGLGLAAAAAFVAVSGVAIWLGINVARLNGRLAAEEQRRAELEEAERDLRSRLEAEQGNNKELADELRQVQQQLNALQQRGAAGSVASLLLPPSSIRGSGRAQEVRLGPGVASLDLQLDVNGFDFGLYHATVRPLSGGVVWSGNNLKPVRGSSGKIIKIRLPAATLKTGLYVITLDGINTLGEAMYAGEYSFTVVRQ